MPLAPYMGSWQVQRCTPHRLRYREGPEYLWETSIRPYWARNPHPLSSACSSYLEARTPRQFAHTQVRSSLRAEACCSGLEPRSKVTRWVQQPLGASSSTALIALRRSCAAALHIASDSGSFDDNRSRSMPKPS